VRSLVNLHGGNKKENQNKKKQEADTTGEIRWKKKTKALVNLTVRTIRT